MAGMPSARGIEWKGDGHSHERFEYGFDNIPRNPDGTMRIDPLYVPEPTLPQPPESCQVCTLLDNCDAGCANGSAQCRSRLGI
jgi:hypothetical protein